MLQRRLHAGVHQGKALEKYIWRNTNLTSINMMIGLGWRDLIDIDVMSHLF